MSWNDVNVAKLKELWEQGLPTAQIGKLIGFTKNAVVGKAHRIGLERRPSPIRRTAAKPDRKKARSPVMPKLNFDHNESDQIPNNIEIKSFQPSVRNIFIANTTRGCEWPEGHPDEPEFNFCSKERYEEKPYCIDHCAIAYIIPDKEESKPMARSRTVKFK